MSSVIQDPNEIRVLAVRQPWASLIVEGLKTIEVRSSRTKIRGRIAIYSSEYKNTEEEEGDFIEHFQNLEKKNIISYSELKHVKDLIFNGEKGKIIGTVELTDSSKNSIYDIGTYKSYKNCHLTSDLYFVDRNTFFWHLANPNKFLDPIPYKPPKGAVVWSRTVLPEGY